MKGDFIPATQADLDTWEVNFRDKLSPITQELKVDASLIEATLGKLDKHRGDYALMVSKRAEAKAATSTNNQIEKEAIEAYREVANIIKASSRYTEAIGQELRIIGSEHGFDKVNTKPALLVSLEGGVAVIKFTKDKADGVHIYSRRNGEKEFSFLAVDTVSPYHDNRPNQVPGQPEVREYKAWHFLDDTIIGQESDVVSITL